MNSPPPVVHRIVVELPPARAFALFTEGLSRWWPFRSHSCGGRDGAEVRFEQHVGGAVTEIAPDGVHHAWGVLTAWSPPAYFAMTWHPGQPAAQATALSVRFTAVADGCEVVLEHGGWAARGDEADTVRENYQKGWPIVLGNYLRLSREIRG